MNVLNIDSTEEDDCGEDGDGTEYNKSRDLIKSFKHLKFIKLRQTDKWKETYKKQFYEAKLQNVASSSEFISAIDEFVIFIQKSKKSKILL